MTAYEDFVIDMVTQGSSIVGLYPMTDPPNEIRFAEWRAAKVASRTADYQHPLTAI